VRKKIFLLLFVLCVVLEINAQKAMSVIVFDMGQHCSMINKNERQYRSLIKTKRSVNNAMGILVRQQIRSRFHINYGIYYSFQTKKYEVIFENTNISGTINVSYLKLPFLLQYNFVNKERVNFFITAGPQIDFLMVEDGAIPAYTIDKDSNGNLFMSTFYLLEVGGGYKPIVIDGVCSIGTEFRLYKNLFYNLQVRFDHSFYDVENKSYKFIDPDFKFNPYKDLDNSKGPTYNMTIGIAGAFSLKIR
jgi:hypothetical protein